MITLMNTAREARGMRNGPAVIVPQTTVWQEMETVA